MNARSWIVGVLMVSLMNPSARADQPTPAVPTPPVAGDAQPKFFLVGFILKAIASEVFSMFGKWAIQKMVSGTSLSIPLGTKFLPLNFVKKSADESVSPPSVVAGEPIAAKGMQSAPANYQGLHIAIAVLDPEGKTLQLRPLKQGFRSGERFKLRVLATFGGDMKIENINPHGVRKHIYPQDENLRIRLEEGKEALIPAGPDEYFEFARTTGEEQLVVTIRDPRADAKTASRARVYRLDEPYGSNFVQEVSDNTYAVISESVKLQHF